MKKKYCYLTAFALIGLTACTNDADLVIPETGGSAGFPNGRVPLAFSLNGLNSGAVPYTRAPIALAGEKEIRTLDVFVFGTDTMPDGKEKTDGKVLLEEVFRTGVTGGISLTTQGDVQTAELSVLGTNRKFFYFVANGREQDALTKFQTGVTDTLVFHDALTDALTGHIASPLLMTANKAVSIKDSLIDKPGDLDWTKKIGIELLRRMARFDIVNTGVDSQFFIEWIQLTNARKQNYLFVSNKHATAYPIASELFNPERIDFKSLDNANNGETQAAFYAYAASKEVVDETKDFTIILGGKSGNTGQGSPIAYPVKMRTDQEDPTTALEIKANNRYVINIKSSGNNIITANIEVQDWIKADTLSSHTGYGIFGLSMPVTDPKGTMTANTLTLTKSVATPDIVVNLAVTSEWVVESFSEWITVTAPTSGTVAKTMTFATTKANPRNDKSRIGTIVFRNKMRPSITQTLLVEQPKSNGDFLNVDMPSGITGLSIKGDSITLPGYAAIISLPFTVTAGKTVKVASSNAMASGVENGTNLDITLEENTTGKDRQCVLTFADGGDLEQKYILIQKAKSQGTILILDGNGVVGGMLKLAATDVTAKTIKVEASSAWIFEDDDDADPSNGYTKNWITVSNVQGNGTAKGIFDVAATANTTFASRDISIKLVNKEKPTIFKSLVIRQEAKAETFEVAGTGLVGTTLSIALDAVDPIELTVTADLKDGTWELVGAGTTVGVDNWLTLGTVVGNKISVTPSANTGTERSATITIQKVGGDVKQEITVTQAGV